MLFGWWRRRRRRKVLARPEPSGWRKTLSKELELYDRLGATEQDQLLSTARILVAEKSWEGAGGLELQEKHVLVIAAQAALLLLGLEHDYYPNVDSVVVYPAGYRIPGGADAMGVVSSEGRDVLGTAHMGGPVVLSWRSARSGGRDADDGRNLVLHEFAHKLDMLDGVVDGTPVLEASAYSTWFEVMTEHYEALVRRTERGRRGLLDGYGATSVAEFFAVVTETFFEKPRQLRKEHPELYRVLQGFYRQDPAEWPIR